MYIILFLSKALVPILIFMIVGYGMLQKKPVYELFIQGTVKGLKTVIKIMPTLIGLMMAVGVLRGSGSLDALTKALVRILPVSKICVRLIPLAIIRLFSSSAATAVVLDLFKEYGPDSMTGLTASLMMSCTETVFYTMSVYFIAARVKYGRYTLPGALLSAAAGIGASFMLVKWM